MGKEMNLNILLKENNKKILSLLGIKFLEVNSVNFSKMNKLIRYSKRYSQPVAFFISQ